ncbi:MAG: ABC transporter permease [Bacteroidota bacterium]|nr:ABC transporter permease [Bacteroidota bacterium]
MEPISKQPAKYVISKNVDSFFSEIYAIIKFIGLFFKEVFTPPYEPREVIKQCYEIGYRSLALISLTGFITGLVFTKQSRPSLSEFGATSWLPSLVGIAIIRALAPLITALICAGKVGSNIGAELGSMRVSEQIEAMEMSAADPFKFLVVSRVVATTIMVPLLVMYMGLIGLLGSYVNVHVNEQTSFTVFFHDALVKISFLDYTASVIKAIVYGFTIGIVGCYKGFNATKGTEGVGRAANVSVVISMFLIFIEEIIIVQIINWIRYAG